MELMKSKFLLDENVPIKLKTYLREIGISCNSLKDFGLLGFKNGELSKEVNQMGAILITRDSDFKFLWQKYKIKVIYFSISPTDLNLIKDKFSELFSNFNFSINNPFYVHLSQFNIKYWN